MIQGIKTSILSLLCVAASSAAFAAPVVRTVGGSGSYESAASAANATAASRAGSLRATGGYIRPTTTVSSGTAVKAATATTAPATTGTTVATGGATVGRVASSPRLSIGKYIGAPKSVSSSGGAGSDLTERVERLETEIIRIESDKQDVLDGSEYIIVDQDNNDVVLDFEHLKEDLDIQNREIDFSHDDTALYWHYIDEGENTWHEIFTWEELATNVDLSGVIAMINQKVNDLRTELTAELDKKVDKDQGTDNAGKVLMVNNDGIVEPSDVEYATTTDIDNAIDGLGALAYKDTVDTEDIENGAVVRAKLASDITRQLDGVQFWEDWWRSHQDELESGDYVVAVQPGTRTPQLFRVISADESVGGDSRPPVDSIDPVPGGDGRI